MGSAHGRLQVQLLLTALNFYKIMIVKANIKTFKDKRILLPREEFSWEIADKILEIKLGFWKWDIRVSFSVLY